MPQAPGTVSKILWHFTGGPKWNPRRNCQAKRRKPETDAYNALLSILRSKELKLGDYREVVKVQVPKQRQRDEGTGESKIVKNAVIELESVPVCCVSDIPIAHLSYQAQRYGRIAVGFHRKAVVRHGFNPVFYSLHHTDVLQSMYRGFEELVSVDASEIDSLASDLESSTTSVQCEECDHEFEVDADISGGIDEIQSAAQNIQGAVSTAEEDLRKFLAFVKTFGPREFSTIYCEREWRSTQPFRFRNQDVAMIILPKRSASRSFFDDFAKTRAKGLRINRSIPVVPWEDLIEH